MKFMINRGGWADVDAGIVLADGRLAWWRGAEKGIAPPPYWMLSEETTGDPDFRAVCWSALTPEERSSAEARMGLVAA